MSDAPKGPSWSRYFVFTTTIGGCGAAVLALGGPGPIGSALLGASALLTFLGVRSKRSHAQIRLVNAAYARIQADDIAGARALLESPAVRKLSSVARRGLLLHRAALFVRAGAFDEAAASLDEALLIATKRASQPYEERFRADLHGLRAVVATALRDAETAERSIAAVRAAPDASAQALARATLAELILSVRADRIADARVLWRANVPLLESATDGRERSALRGLVELLREAPSSPYREAPAPPRTEGALEATTWARALVPEASSFIDAEAALLAPAAAETPTQEARREIAESRRAAARTAQRSWAPWRTWALTSAGLLGLLAVFLGSTNGLPGAEHASLPSWAIVPPMLLLFGGFYLHFRGQSVRTQRAILDLYRGLNALVVDDLDGAEAAGRRACAVGSTTLFAYGCLARTGAALRRHDPPAALAHLDAALGRLEREPKVRAALVDVLVPALIASRADVLAWLDRPDEARAELAQLPAASAISPTLVLPVEILLAARKGDFSRAAALVATRPAAIVLPRRSELLGDAARLASDPASLTPRETRRIRENLRDPMLAAWLERAAPALFAAVNGEPIASDLDDAIAAEESAALRA